MTRLTLPFATPDLSAFAKTLKSFLHERHEAGKPPPSHVELLNLLARAAGLRNFATLKAAVLAAPSGSPGPRAAIRETLQDAAAGHAVAHRSQDPDAV